MLRDVKRQSFKIIFNNVDASIEPKDFKASLLYKMTVKQHISHMPLSFFVTKSLKIAILYKKSY